MMQSNTQFRRYISLRSCQVGWQGHAKLVRTKVLMRVGKMARNTPHVVHTGTAPRGFH